MTEDEKHYIDEDNASVFSEDMNQLFGEDENLSSSGGSDCHIEVAKEDMKLMNVVRALILLVLMTMGALSSEVVFIVATTAEESNFEEAYIEKSGKSAVLGLVCCHGIQEPCLTPYRYYHRKLLREDS